jgi:predicted GIY-YIG superfamily endonuclease
VICTIDYREDNKWTVYIHTSPSGKYYVGITSLKPEERWQNGNGYHGQMFKYAIQKYGWSNFEHEIIAEHLTKTEAEEFEKFLIYLLKSNISGYGYNVASGGLHGGCGGSPANFDDLTGKQFGLWNVIKRVDDRVCADGQHTICWLCKCECGTEKIVTSDSLKWTNSKDCGCKRKERFRQTFKNIRNNTAKYDLTSDYGKGCTYDNYEFYFDLEDYDIIKELAITYSSNNLGVYDYNFKCRKPLHYYIFGNKEGLIIFLNHNNLDYRKENIKFVDSKTFTAYHHLYNNKDNLLYRIVLDKTCKQIIYRLSSFGNGYAFDNIDDAIYQRNILIKDKYKDNELLSNLVALFYCN